MAATASDGRIQYIIELLQQGDTKAAIADLQKFDAQAKATDDGLSKLGDTARDTLAAIGSALAVRSAIAAWVDYEHAVARLDGTLKATGNDSPAFRAELMAQAKAFSQSTEESSKSVLGIQTLLISFGATREQLPQLTKAVIDLSAGMGVDANTAALELSKALEGIDGPLKRMGITFDDNASRSERFASAVTQVEQRFGGLAATIKNTDSGKLNDLEKAAGGLKKTFGELALEGLLPAIESTTQLANATKDFISQGSLAGEYAKELALVAGTVGTLTAGVKGFGLAWQFVAGDAIKQAGGLKAALASIPTAIQVVIVAAAVYQVYQAVREGLAAADAGKQQASSAQDLGLQNDKRRSALESQINAGTSSGQISADKAAAYRARIKTAFTPQDTDYSSGGELGSNSSTPSRNYIAESDALTAIFKQLTGFGASAPTGDTSKESQQVIDDRKKGLSELGKLEDTMTAKSLEGFDQQRAEAEKLYNDQSTQIDNLARKFSLSETDRSRAQQENFDEYASKSDAIDAAEQQKKTEDAQKLADLKAQFQAEGLTGLQREIAVEDTRYQRAIAHINAEKSLSPADRTQLLGLNDSAHTNAAKAFDQARPSEDLKIFEEQLTQSQIGSSETRVQTAQREYEARVAYYKELLAQGKLTEGGLTQSIQDAAKQRAQILAPAVESGRLESQKLSAGPAGSFDQHVVDVNKEYDARKANLEAYFDWQLQKEQDNADRVVQINTQKTTQLAQLEVERQNATNQTYQDFVKIGDYAENSFASGISSAFVSFIDGSKSASDAFKDFAASFLQQVAQMILQLIILQTIKAAFSSFSGGGVATNSAGVTPNYTVNALGGLNFRAAAAGVMLAAAGVAGVNEVNGPTYFPRFNVLAGEAGSEMMAVLAKPTTGMVNGQRVVMGNVGHDKLALMSQDSLARMVQQSGTSAFAGGGLANTSGIGGTLGVSKTTSDVSGKIVVELTPHPAYEQRIVSNSIRGAQVQIASDLSTDTQVRRAAKGILT